jgi:PII-like signaling protein
VVEIIDTEEKIVTLLPHLETMVREGMITMERVMILAYRGPQQALSRAE